MLENTCQFFLIILALSAVCTLFYRILLSAFGLFIFGAIILVAFIELYGFYLFFSEINLFLIAFQMYGIKSFSTMFIGGNIFLSILIGKWLSQNYKVRFH